jgi:hypothetical protein
MVIYRCCWHPRNHGHAKLLGIKSWGGRGLLFHDALCTKCAPRIHPDVRAKLGLEVVTWRSRAVLAAIILVLSTVVGLMCVRPTEVSRQDGAATMRMRLVEAGEVGPEVTSVRPTSSGRPRRSRVSRAASSPTDRTIRLHHDARRPIHGFSDHRSPVHEVRVYQAP